MVAEVGRRTRIIEREHGADEQRTLVVAHRERAAESGAGLAVRHIAVGKEDAAGSRETVLQLARLADEAVTQLDAAMDARATTDDGILADHTGADDDGVLYRAADGAVAQSGNATQLASVIDDGVDDNACVDNLHMVADGAALWTGIGHGLSDHALDGTHHGFVITMLDHEGRQLAIEFTEQQQVAVAHLVEDCDGVALAIVGLALGVDGAHVGDVAPVTDGHVIQVITDILDQAVVADSHVAQRSVIDAAILYKAVGNFHGAAAISQARPAVELHTVATAGIKVSSHHDIVPVLCPTIFFLQGLDLLFGQMEVFFHVD